MKTKPYGVRFDIDKMELLKNAHDINTPQRAVNFLFDFWIQNKNIESDIAKRVGVLEAKTNILNYNLGKQEILDYCNRKIDYLTILKDGFHPSEDKYKEYCSIIKPLRVLAIRLQQEINQFSPIP